MSKQAVGRRLEPAGALAPLVFMGLIGLDSHNREEARLVQRLAERGHPVLYLAPLGIRDPSPRTWLDGLRRLRHATRSRSPAGRLRSAALLVLPWRRVRPVAWLNGRLVRWQLARAMRRVTHERPVFWLRLPTPELVEQLDQLGVRAVVYECIDDYSAYPQYGPRDLHRLAQSERMLVARANLVVTLSARVADRFPEAVGRRHVVPLGTDLAYFGDAPGSPASELAQLPRPRLGLVGGLDERVDFDLLRSLAIAEPNWSIVLVGPALDQAGLRCLADLPNVYLVGPLAHARVPEYLAGFDACLIPYRRSRWTDGCFPAKLHEYLASGRPVIATNLPGLATYAGLIDLADDPQAFVTACRHRVAECVPADSQRRRAVATAASLEDRCQTIDTLLATLPA